MMAFDVLPTHRHETTVRRSSARPPLPKPRLRRNGSAVASALLVVASLAGLGAGSAALADASPGLTAPQQEELHHSRTGCLTPACPA